MTFVIGIIFWSFQIWLNFVHPSLSLKNKCTFFEKGKLTDEVIRVSRGKGRTSRICKLMGLPSGMRASQTFQAFQAFLFFEVKFTLFWQLDNQVQWTIVGDLQNTFELYSQKVISKSPSASKWTYLIPIKIRTPLIFAHLACAKIKGSKFAQ